MEVVLEAAGTVVRMAQEVVSLVVIEVADTLAVAMMV